MPKLFDPLTNVLEAARERIRLHYLAGDTVVVSVSGGKDSTVIMELCIQVARELKCLPVNVQTRDEEIMAPGTYEYLERVYHTRHGSDIDFRWHIAGQPIINSFNRFLPYWWVFDDRYPDLWLRQAAVMGHMD